MPLILLILIVSVSFSGVVARVGDTVITREEFEEKFNRYWKEILHFNTIEPTEEDRRRFLIDYVKGVLLEKVAHQMGIVVEESEVEERLSLWGKRQASAIVKEMVRKEILMERLEERLTGNVKVSENEIRAYYILNRREFYYPDQVKLLRVVAPDEKTAYRVYRLLRRGGDLSGEDVVVGRERWYSIQALPEAIRRRLYPYSVGMVSRPLELETGYLILKVTDRRKAGFLPLSEVKEEVRNRILRMKKKEVLERWFKDILKTYSVELYF